ncbi:MAG: thioredoxin domain-containing protein [Candidatus Gracilibacteria bacterium]|nr:thioredoxin domain-containing protein [Candidatus Gracilibacteria bacterium]
MKSSIYKISIFFLCTFLITACSGGDLKGSVSETGAQVSIPTSYFTSDDPFLGDDGAALNMVVFSDFECPYCAEFYKEVKGLEKNWVNTGKLKIQFRDFPLGIHDHALPVHIAANAAKLQGKYWQAHEKLYSEQEKWNRSSDINVYLMKFAKDLNLDEEKFISDMKKPGLIEEIYADRDEGRLAGVTGTPGFLINDQIFRGALSLKELEKELKFIEGTL